MRNVSRLIKLTVVCALVTSIGTLYIAASAAASQGALQEASSGGLQEDAPLAQVVAVVGVVRVTSGGSQVSLTEPQIPFPLRGGDRLEAGDDGRASVLFANGTLVRVNSLSVLEVDAPSSSGTGMWARLRILLGEVLIHVLPGNREMQFETPDAIAAVRGTYFDIQVVRAMDGDSISSITTLTTLEGLVAFGAGGTETEVGAGQRSTVRGGDAPTRPESVDLAQSLARLDTWVKDLKDKEPAGLRKAGAPEDVISEHEKAGLRGSGPHGQGNGAGLDEPRNREATDSAGSSARPDHAPDHPEQQTEQPKD